MRHFFYTAIPHQKSWCRAENWQLNQKLAENYYDHVVCYKLPVLDIWLGVFEQSVKEH
jgi:hypothetical protein